MTLLLTKGELINQFRACDSLVTELCDAFKKAFIRFNSAIEKKEYSDTITYNAIMQLTSLYINGIAINLKEAIYVRDDITTNNRVVEALDHIRKTIKDADVKEVIDYVYHWMKKLEENDEIGEAEENETIELLDEMDKTIQQTIDEYHVKREFCRMEEDPEELNLIITD